MRPVCHGNWPGERAVPGAGAAARHREPNRLRGAEGLGREERSFFPLKDRK